MRYLIEIQNLINRTRYGRDLLAVSKETCMLSMLAAVFQNPGMDFICMSIAPILSGFAQDKFRTHILESTWNNEKTLGHKITGF